MAEETAADALRAVARLFESVVTEIEEARLEPDDIERLRQQARRGAQITGRQLLEPISIEPDITAATERFVRQSSSLFEAYRLGRIEGEQLAPEVRRAYLRQARKVYRAGKRSLGSRHALTLEDERDIADSVDRLGLSPGDNTQRSLGGVLNRATSLPELTREQRAVMRTVDEALALYVKTLIQEVMRRTREVPDDELQWAIEKQVALARERIGRQVAEGRRRILTGTLAGDAAVALVATALQAEAERAYVRALRLDGLSTMTPQDAIDLEQAQRRTEDSLRTSTGFHFGIGTLLLLALIAPSAIESQVGQWFVKRLGQFGGSLWGMGQAGRKAAFRTGTPAPRDYADGSLPGVGVPTPAPNELERQVVVWWELEVHAEHCIDCIRLSDMSPFYLSVLQKEGIYPGSHHTRCRDNCRCELTFEVPEYNETAVSLVPA